MKPLTDKLSPEQRDEFAEWMRWEIFDGDNYLPAKVLKGLDRITAEDECYCKFYPCDWYEDYKLGLTEPPSRNQIALRKKGEFIKEWYQDWVDKKVAWCPDDPTLDDFEEWLQQEDEDG